MPSHNYPLINLSQHRGKPHVILEKGITVVIFHFFAAPFLLLSLTRAPMVSSIPFPCDGRGSSRLPPPTLARRGLGLGFRQVFGIR